ncbi:hypothetical protein AN963_29850 [Brevibacillus choshinensis]|uniref:Major facilitator superfamily (MFS) profile domain-containing protein n=1 Tax=Brevibacillus choshinensis TaxID=54911 RepID=A0ABR5MZY0_BRECH|nr:MFS transporter [Brevibacillus choshinensis]KQL43617.1 hypothetical protein AN963_29850 [Brevibacillus choshinensis]
MEQVNQKRKYILLVILFLAWLVGNIDKVAINFAVIPMGKELGFDAKQTGLILSSFFLSYAIMQLLGGWWADKKGSRNVLIISVALWSIFTALTGAGWSLGSLILIRFLFGLGEGSFPSASSVAIGENFTKPERARAKSVLLAASPFGAMLGGILASWLILSTGWRSMFGIFGILGVLITVLLWRFLPKREQKLATNVIEGKEQPMVKPSMKQVLKTPMVWSLLLMWFGMSIVTWGLISWMPSYWINVRHLNMVSTGLISSIPAIAGVVFTIFSGWMLDKYLKGKEKYWGTFGALISGIFLYLMFTAPTIQLAVFYNTLCMIGITFVNTTVFSMPLKLMPQEVIGSATGAINFGGYIAGVIAPSAMGYIITTGSYDAALLFLVICTVIPVIAGLTIRTKKLRLEAEESANHA